MMMRRQSFGNKDNDQLIGTHPFFPRTPFQTRMKIFGNTANKMPAKRLAFPWSRDGSAILGMRGHPAFKVTRMSPARMPSSSAIFWG
ncbi:MAG: hypothetical protein WCP34_05645, partial [Pseudomonadota bacterium]